MITRRETVPLLLEACPSFREWFEGMGPFFTDKLWRECSRQVLSLFFTNLSWHLLFLYGERQMETFPLLADAFERLLAEGDEEVRVVSIRDLLESIECIWSYNKVDPNEFFAFLGPKAIRYRNEICQAAATNTRALTAD
ncbi:MAG: DUF7674 family protein [Limisphaerales bacterium]